MNRVDKQKGFTLIELLLAMSFVSALLLVIAMTVIQVGSIYSRGMMLKEVNQVSRTISNDLSRSINTQGEIVPTTDYIQVVSGGLKIGGRLCLGTVSYIWNYGEAVQRNHTDLARDGNGNVIRIDKVVDPTKRYCAKLGGGGLAQRNILAADRSVTSELLREGDRTLELYQLDLINESTAYDSSTKQRLYTIEYTIGSGNYTALNTGRTACKGPAEAGSDLQYCTVEQYSLVVRAGGQ